MLSHVRELPVHIICILFNEVVLFGLQGTQVLSKHDLVEDMSGSSSRTPRTGPSLKSGGALLPGWQQMPPGGKQKSKQGMSGQEGWWEREGAPLFTNRVDFLKEEVVLVFPNPEGTMADSFVHRGVPWTVLVSNLPICKSRFWIPGTQKSQESSFSI